MQTCTMCHQSTVEIDPFCRSCGQERIVESLQAPKERPPWFAQAIKAGAAIVGVWLIITVGVAFLREAKALRHARAALEANSAQKAYQWIAPFVAEHPDHLEGRFLAGWSAVQTDHASEAIAHYSKLAGLVENEDAGERARRLEAIYREQIPRNAAGLRCGQSEFADFYATYEALGVAFHDTLLESAANVARKCVVSNRPELANEPGYWLINERKLDPELVVTTLYVGPLRSTLESGQYQLARQLAAQAVDQWPQAEPLVADHLSEVRFKVAKTKEDVGNLCSAVRKDPEFRQGRNSCFPASPPAAVINQKDAWGNQLVYIPMNEKAGCYQAFALASLGADGESTPKRSKTSMSKTPIVDLSCYVDWRIQWALPDRFWFPPEARR